MANYPKKSPKNRLIKPLSALLAAAGMLGSTANSYAEEPKDAKPAETAELAETAAVENKRESSQSTEENSQSTGETIKTEDGAIRAYLDASVGASFWWINGVMNQSGWFYDIESLFGAQITPALGVEAQLEVNSSPYKIEDERTGDNIASGSVNEITTKLEARVNLLAEKNVTIFSKLGAELWNYNDTISYLGEELSLKHQTIGPVISAGLEWAYLDIILSNYKGLGQKDTSYEPVTGIAEDKLELKVVPKYSLFHCPILFRYSYSNISKDSKEGYNHKYTLSIKPGIDIIEDHLSLFLDGKYTETKSVDDQYKRFDFGGGVGAKW